MIASQPSPDQFGHSTLPAEPFIIPEPMTPGSLIAIASPASIVDPAYVDGAAQALKAAGYRVRIMPHALDCCGTFAGSADRRLADFVEAFTDPEVRAILCSRGGYGCIQLLDELDKLPLRSDPKWLIGFSDVTALHALMFRHGIASIHASMVKSLALHPLDAEPNRRLLNILRGTPDPDPVRAAVAADPNPQLIIGGNLALLQALIGTRFDMMSNALAQIEASSETLERIKNSANTLEAPAVGYSKGITLFIEDVSEPLYRVNRMLWQMKFAGWFDCISHLVVGQFTNYRPDANFPDAESMLRDFFGCVPDPEVPNLYSCIRFPNLRITFGAPIGHVDSNLPILLSPGISSPSL